MIETDKKFYRVPVIISSIIWERGYHLYEADSAEDALKMYHDNITPCDIETTGWLDQEYHDDELDTADEIEEIPTSDPIVQDALQWIQFEELERKNA